MATIELKVVGINADEVADGTEKVQMTRPERDALAQLITTSGAQGPAGPQGPQGDAGPAGADGAPGPQGPVGPQGELGLTGPTGLQGEQGPAGADGAQGPAGAAGALGVPGERGEKGDTGERGPAGEQGLKGDTGDPGAQGNPGERGPEGEQGIPGLKGDTGATGPVYTGTVADMTAGGLAPSVDVVYHFSATALTINPTTDTARMFQTFVLMGAGPFTFQGAAGHTVLGAAFSVNGGSPTAPVSVTFSRNPALLTQVRRVNR